MTGDTEWIGFVPNRVSRVLNGWQLGVTRSATGFIAVGVKLGEPTRGQGDIHGLTNALILAEGFATDPEPPPPGVRDRLLKRVAEELVPESAA